MLARCLCPGLNFDLFLSLGLAPLVIILSFQQLGMFGLSHGLGATLFLGHGTKIGILL